HTDDKIHDIELRTKIIQYLEKLALEQYDNLEKNLQKAAKDEQIMGKIEKGIYLRSIDSLWIEHLDAIEHLRRGIGLRGYGQRDPLVEYKKEAYRMFTELNHLIEKQIVYSIYKVGMATQIAPSLLKRRGINVTAPPKTMAEEKSFAAQPQEPGEGKAPVTSYAPDHPHNPPKVGRNEPCPCGSGKKYKKCHG
ncbi:SEC-C domain-containing protein, partial [Candidatus Peregrinibacteria bacterium]|nr:SEC-C domain-containing protein [Candidatus Peregrinibacteria bacterium]